MENTEIIEYDIFVRYIGQQDKFIGKQYYMEYNGYFIDGGKLFNENGSTEFARATHNSKIVFKKVK